MATGPHPKQTSLRDLLRASWVRTSLKIGIILTAAALIIIWLLKIFNVAATPLFHDMETFFPNYGLAGIFLATILAGTVVPLGSPALVAAAALFGVNPLELIIVASIGFTLGMAINYLLAFKLGRPYVAKKMAPDQLEDIDRAWDRWGIVLYVVFGLTIVLPVELLSFICGLFKTNIAKFLLISFLPRLFVFTIIVYFARHLGAWLNV